MRGTASRLMLASAIVWGAFAAPPAQAAQAVQVAAEPTAQFLDARAGVVAWTRQDGDSARLVVRRKGVTADAPGAPPPAGPIDLGVDRGGRPVVTYPTCAATRCRAIAYDLGSARSRTLRTAFRPGCRISAVSIWRARVVAVGSCPGVYEARLLLDGRRRTLRAGIVPARVDVWRSTVVGSSSGDMEGRITLLANGGRLCSRLIWSGYAGPDYGLDVGLAHVGAHGITWTYRNQHVELMSSRPRRGCRYAIGSTTDLRPLQPDDTRFLYEAAVAAGAVYGVVPESGIWTLPLS